MVIGGCQTAFKHIKPSFPVVDHIYEFGFYQLTVVIGDGVFKRIFVALFALAFVAAGLKATTQNGYTLLKY